MVNLIMAILMAVGVVFGGGAATAYASQDTLPGDVLYPAKLLTEQAELALTFDPQEKAELHLELAQERVREMQMLAEQHRQADWQELAENAQAHLREAASLAEQLAAGQHGEALQRIAAMQSAMAQMTEQVMATMQTAIGAGDAHMGEAMQQVAVLREQAMTAYAHAEEQASRLGNAHVTFRIAGQVESINGEHMTVNGEVVALPDDVHVSGDLMAGDFVEVHGLVNADGDKVAVQVAVVRRGEAEGTPMATITQKGTLSVDPQSGTVSINGQPVQMTNATEVLGELQDGVEAVVTTYAKGGETIAQRIMVLPAPQNGSATPAQQNGNHGQAQQGGGDARDIANTPAPEATPTATDTPFGWGQFMPTATATPRGGHH